MFGGYSVLIRTYNSAGTLPSTLRSLQTQTVLPTQLVVVDSGSTDETLALLPPDTVVWRYEGPVYNYSSALNQGIRLVTEPEVLIISSHTVLRNPNSMEYGLEMLATWPQVGAAYFVDDTADVLSHQIIDVGSFDGKNGLWNTCAIVRTHLADQRPFRPEVFAAEDQEWATWLYSRGMTTARISGGGMDNSSNRLTRWQRWNKRLIEETAIALFVPVHGQSVPTPEDLVRRAFAPTAARPLSRRALDLVVAARVARHQ